MKSETFNPIPTQVLLMSSMLAIAVISLLLFSPVLTQAQKHDPEAEVVKLWPNGNPDDDRNVGTEKDFTRASDKLIGGRKIIKLGNVSSPEIHLYRPESTNNTGTAVVICPGGGFNILAWDLEGTEVAKWFNSIGVTAAVVKYRVPTNRLKVPWQRPVQDTQRAISLLRSRNEELSLNTERIGALGFSAGAIAAARTGLMDNRTYVAQDEFDQAGCKPDFLALIYAGGLSNTAGTGLSSGLIVGKDTPPTFLVHAFDDHVPLDHPMVLLRALKKSNVPSELHVYDAGGHGYGLRRVNEFPVTSWPDRLNEWMNRRGLLDMEPIKK
jgi:acetyl esterase/lipase